MNKNLGYIETAIKYNVKPNSIKRWKYNYEKNNPI